MVVAQHMFGQRRQTVRATVRNHVDAMKVAVQKVAIRYAQSTNLHRIAEIHHVRVGMGDGYVSGEDLILQRLDSGEVAHRAVGHASYASKRARDARVSLSQQGPQPGL